MQRNIASPSPSISAFCTHRIRTQRPRRLPYVLTPCTHRTPSRPARLSPFGELAARTPHLAYAPGTVRPHDLMPLQCAKPSIMATTSARLSESAMTRDKDTIGQNTLRGTGRIMSARQAGDTARRVATERGDRQTGKLWMICAGECRAIQHLPPAARC